ncbi:hypothetical protein LY76DRAFT_587583 [Colletotrichum caudatum]|nr:hypothetical protein LY76DRAFT_587583 [Colletotrichum caudatum]
MAWSAQCVRCGVHQSGWTSRQIETSRNADANAVRACVRVYLRPDPLLVSLSLSLSVSLALCTCLGFGWKVRCMHGQRRGDDRANGLPGSDGPGWSNED